MALPNNGAPWPTPVISECSSAWSKWAALLATDSGNITKNTDRVSVISGETGPAGVRRLFQNLNIYSAPSNRQKLCEPEQIDLAVSSALKVATVSSEAVFSKLPTVKSPSAGTQELLDKIQEGSFWGVIQDAEVLSSALGGVWLTTQWNEEMSDRILPRVIRADQAEPTFRNGVLESVAFFFELDGERESNTHWRLVESHELLPDGRGVVLYGLYEGSATSLGKMVPLTEHPDAAVFVDGLDPELGNGYFTGLIGRLSVFYVRNAKPSFLWKGASARHLGVSDFSGAEKTIAELDWWVTMRAREARRNITRIHIPERYAQMDGPGGGYRVDIDRDVYTMFSGNDVFSADGGSNELQVKLTQGTMRNEEYQKAIDDCWRRIASSTGFSLSSMGAVNDQGIQTATGVRAQKDATARTADLKRAVWRNALVGLFSVMVEQQALVFGGPSVDTESITVEFSNTDTIDESELAQTVSTLLGAGAISKKTAVRMLHPDWDEAQVLEELEEIAGSAPKVVVAQPSPEEVGADVPMEEPADISEAEDATTDFKE